MFFFFQAEDGIRDAQESRGLGDVYKRQIMVVAAIFGVVNAIVKPLFTFASAPLLLLTLGLFLSLIHI